MDGNGKHMTNSSRYLLDAYRYLILSYLEFDEYVRVYGPSPYHSYMRDWYREMANSFDKDRHIVNRLLMTKGYDIDEFSNIIEQHSVQPVSEHCTGNGVVE